MQQVVIKYVAKMIVTDDEAEKIKKATENSEFEKTIKSMIDGELFETDRKYRSKVEWKVKE